MKINKKYLRTTLLLQALLLLSCLAISQGINISTGAIVNVSGAATIQIINGNFVNNGTYNKGSETVKMTGSNAMLMLGNGTTNMNDLEIKNTGGITTRLRQINLHNLTIYSASKFTIDTASAINASNFIRNKATVNDLIIKANKDAANGTLVFHNNVDSTVLATVEMYNKASKPSTSYKWQFLGIPLRNLIVDDTFTGSYVRKYNEAGWNSGYTSDKHWIQLVTGNTLTPFTGYEVTQVSPKTIIFQGELVNNNYSSGKLPITVAAQYPGQHLIGNSYTAGIDIKKIEFGSTRAAVIENTVYLYNTGSLAEWTSTGLSGNSAGELAGQYVGVPTNIAGENGLPSQIPSMQAFLVAAVSDNDSANIKIPYNAVGTMVRNTDKQRMKSSINTSTRINIKGSRFEDKMWLFTNANCNKDFDNGWDAKKFIGSNLAPQIFASESNEAYQVDAVSNINNTDIGFIGGEDAQYTMTFTHTNLETNYSKLYLVDNAINQTVDITQSGTQYIFDAQVAGSTVNRFKIIANSNITTDATSFNADLKVSKVYNNGKTMFVNNTSENICTLTLYDYIGKVVLVSAVQHGITPINTTLKPGVYVAELQATEETVTVKLFIR